MYQMDDVRNTDLSFDRDEDESYRLPAPRLTVLAERAALDALFPLEESDLEALIAEWKQDENGR